MIFCHCGVETKKVRIATRVKGCWKIISKNLSNAGWRWGCVSAVDSNGRTIWIADAHRDDGNRFVARADEKLTAFIELGSSRFALERFLESVSLALKLLEASRTLRYESTTGEIWRDRSRGKALHA
jgi:hypothetical protein